MPYYIKEAKRDHNFDNHSYREFWLGPSSPHLWTWTLSVWKEQVLTPVVQAPIRVVPKPQLLQALGEHVHIDLRQNQTSGILHDVFLPVYIYYIYIYLQNMDTGGYIYTYLVCRIHIFCIDLRPRTI